MASKRARKDVTREFLDTHFSINDFKFTEKQRDLIRLLKEDSNQMIFVSGCAGTGKTLVSIFAGLMAIRSGTKSKLLYLRSLIENCKGKMGFLPGTLEQKTNPYEGPLHDKLEELLSAYDAQKLLSEGIVKAMPINFLRGATFRNSFVVVDEAQNLSYSDLVTIITRIGENCTLVLVGDPMQADIGGSGFVKMTDLFSDKRSEENGIHKFEFFSEDIMRSGILRFIMEKLESR